MARLLTCPQGHSWQTTDNGDAPTAGWPSVCPVCGLAPRSSESTQTETADAATLSPPPPSSTPIAGAEADTLAPTAPFLADTGAPLPKTPGYQILERLGSGGMGVVYKARQIGLDRLVAIKFILAGAHAGPKERKRFHDEARAVARLHHPNIVQIYEVGEADGWPFITLEYVDGGNLAHRCNGRPQPPRAAAKLLETLARASHAAHQRGVIHRDLKPGNVLLAADNTPKIADFGLAKHLDGSESQTQSGTVMGTPDYMAPEQAAGKKSLIGPATDIHALGVILYEQLTGRPPYRTGAALDTVLKVISEEPIPPTLWQPKVPRDLETICLKCLQKEPHRRYATAEELAEDLRRFQAGEPILARPASPSERLVRVVKRHRGFALAVGFVSATLFLSVILAAAYIAVALLHVEQRGPAGSAEAEVKVDAEPVEDELVALPPDLDLIPRNSFSFDCLRVSEVLETEGGKNALQQIAAFLKTQPEPLLDALEEHLGVRPSEIERLSHFIPLAPPDVDEKDAAAFSSYEWVAVTTRAPYDRAKVLSRLAPDAQETIANGRPHYESAKMKRFVLFVDDRVFVSGTTGVEHVEKLVFDRDPSVRGPTSTSLNLAAHGNHLWVVSIQLPDALRQKLLPDFFGNDFPRFEALSALDAARLTVDMKPSAKGLATGDVFLLDFAIHFPDEVTASNGEKAANELLRVAQQKLTHVLTHSDLLDELAGVSPALMNEIEVALRAALIERHGPWVHVHTQLRIDLAAVLRDYEANAATRVRQAAERAISRNNLKQLALAMHNYNETKGHLPPAVVYSKDGKTPLYSWRVELLPFLEEDALYKEFHLDEPWDSEHNQPLLKKMPPIFASPKKIEGQEPFKTFYQVFVGPEKEAPFFENRLPRIPATFQDGVSNTLLIAEAGEAVPWTKPADIPYANNRPLPKLGGIFQEGFNACTADANTYFIKPTVGEKILRALITPAGEEPIPVDWNSR